MTNQTIDGVPGLRSLIERVTSQDLGMSAKKDRAEAAHELRALLPAPTCETPRGSACPGDGVGLCKKCPAAQPQGEPVSSKPFRILVRCCHGPVSKQIEKANESTWPDIESARQYFGAEREVDSDRASRLVYISPGEWFATPLYAEQPAPVAVVMPERLPGDDGVCTESHYASGWNDCLDELKRLNTARPAHANPPPGTEPCGTHHDNDGLDEWRKPACCGSCPGGCHIGAKP